MESIKDKVAVVGMGRTQAGELWGKDHSDLLVEACYEAFEDARIDPKDIQAGVLGQYFGMPSGLSLATALQLEYIPVTRVENACATGGDAFRTAAAFVASGLYDVIVVAGVEKQKDSGTTGQQGHGEIGTQTGTPSPPPAGVGAVAGMRYAHEYGLSMDELKKTMYQIARKNHHNGTLTPRAQYQMELSWDRYIDAPMMAYPLGLYDCCGVSDGAAAAVICRADLAKHFRDDYVLLKASGMATGAQQPQLRQGGDYVHFMENTIAANVAYEMAGIKDPMKEISMAEIHDAFTTVELVSIEDVGFAPKGQAPGYIAEGYYELEGQIPINTDGGLKCNGHPIGATGMIQIYEVYKQMQAKAGARQVPNPRIGMAHNQGGSAGGGVSCMVALLSPRD